MQFEAIDAMNSSRNSTFRIFKISNSNLHLPKADWHNLFAHDEAPDPLITPLSPILLNYVPRIGGERRELRWLGLAYLLACSTPVRNCYFFGLQSCLSIHQIIYRGLCRFSRMIIWWSLDGFWLRTPRVLSFYPFRHDKKGASLSRFSLS